jgi:hypothetical protein
MSNDVQQHLAELFGIKPEVVEGTMTVTAYRHHKPEYRMGEQYSSLEGIPAWEQWPYIEVQGPDGETWVVGLYQHRKGEFNLSVPPQEKHRVRGTMDDGLWDYWTFEATLPSEVRAYDE